MLRLTCIMTIGSALAVSAGLANDRLGGQGGLADIARRSIIAQAQPKPDVSEGAERGRAGDVRPRGEYRGLRGGRVDTSDRPGGGPMGRKLTPAEEDRALQILGEIDPDSAQRLNELRERDPAAFEKNLPQFGRRLIGLMELEKRQPELFKVRLRELRLEVEVPQLAARIRQLRQQGKVGEADALVPQLREKVKEHQGCRIQARGWELVLLDQHIKAMREQLQEDTLNFDATVKKRVEWYLDPERNDDAPRPPTDVRPAPVLETIGSDSPK